MDARLRAELLERFSLDAYSDIRFDDHIEQSRQDAPDLLLKNQSVYVSGHLNKVKLTRKTTAGQ